MPRKYLKGRLKLPRDAAFWAKLEKVWLEEGLKTRQLAERFDLSYATVYNWLKAKHGTVKSPKKRYD